MKEKSIELSNINSSPLNTDRNYSFGTKNLQQTNQTNISEGETMTFFNNHTNMTSDTTMMSPEINRIRRYTSIDYQKRSKSKSERKEVKTYFKDLNKKIYNCFTSFKRHLDFLSERNINVQVGIVYSVLLIGLSLGIIYLKAKHINDILDTLTKKNYHSFYINNIIDSQREIKVQLDELNNHDIISLGNDPLLFMRLYTEELVSHNILINNSLILETDLQKTFSDLGQNYELSDDLYNLAEIYNDSSSSTSNLKHNIKNMMPFYFLFTPIIINHLNNCGIKLNNFYFIASGSEMCENFNTINTMYFKYPLENIKLGPDVIQKNNKIYDFIIDPLSSCNNEYSNQQEVLNNIQLNNWYSSYLINAGDSAHFKIFKIKKVTGEKKRLDYLIFFSRSNSLNYLENDNDKKIYFTFCMKISQNEDYYPFIKLDERDDILYYDYLSLYNFDDKYSHVSENNKEKIFEIDYNIDDNQNILLRVPKFISNMHLYSMEAETEDDTNSKDKKEESILLKYEELKNMSEYYNINYYFQKDSLIFRLIYFLNEFFLFKKNHPEYLTSTYDNISDSIETSSDHPCTFEGSQEYYELIKYNYGYDCMNDFCFYNNCDQSYEGLEEPKNLYFLPNCYCIPLFCRDTQSSVTDFHNLLKNKIQEDNKTYSDNAYSFTSSYDDYLWKKGYKFSKIDEYFDRQNFIFKCKIQLTQKNNTYNNFFMTKIKIQNMTFQNGDNTFLMFFMNNNMTSFLIDNFQKLNYMYLNYTFFIYVLFVILNMGVLLRYIILQVNNLTNRMEKLKKIRRIIITNQLDSNIYNDDFSNSNFDNNNYDSLTYSNDDNISVNSDDSDSSKKKKKKESEIENKKQSELDELDTLINLINENISDFQIKFNLNEDMNSSINEIKNQYNGIIKVNQYKNKLLMKNYTYNENSIDEDDLSNFSNYEERDEYLDDLSLKIFYELLSTSTSEIDFSNIKNNFYYRKNDGKLLFGLEDVISGFNEEDNSGNGEITNLNKIKNAINYYYANIHDYWEKQYNNMKKEENL